MRYPTPQETRLALSLYGHHPYHGKHHPLVVTQAAYRLVRGSHLAVNMGIVEAAILMHDAGYVVGNAQNEEYAAYDLVPRVLANWHTSDQKRISRIIMDTKEHQPDHRNLESCLVSDADMDGFCAPWDEFEANNADIGDEYLDHGVTGLVLNRSQFTKGRREFLAKTLATAEEGRLYHFPVCLKERHAAAIENLTKVLG